MVLIVNKLRGRFTKKNSKTVLTTEKVLKKSDKQYVKWKD